MTINGKVFGLNSSNTYQDLLIYVEHEHPEILEQVEQAVESFKPKRDFIKLFRPHRKKHGADLIRSIHNPMCPKIIAAMHSSIDVELRKMFGNVHNSNNHSDKPKILEKVRVCSIFFNELKANLNPPQ